MIAISLIKTLSVTPETYGFISDSLLVTYLPDKLQLYLLQIANRTDKMEFGGEMKKILLIFICRIGHYTSDNYLIGIGNWYLVDIGSYP